MNTARSPETFAKLLSSASHTLRTPVSVLMLELGMIEDPRARQLESDVAAYAETVRKSFFLLRLCICDCAPAAAVDLSQIAASIADEFAPAARSKQVDLTVISSNPASFDGCEVAIVETVRCLIDNAVRVAPEGSEVRISCLSDLGLAVEDAGPGIPEEVAQYSFEPFATPPVDSACFGLGLTIATRTARLHGGGLEIGQSAALGGARVAIKLGPLK